MPPSNQLLLRVFAAAIFLSAALLFAVQPMFTKMVLPRLGGTPSVWSVAMVFFQAVLLAGYAYAHALTRYLPGKRSVIVHVVVMAAATLFLPLAIALIAWCGVLMLRTARAGAAPSAATTAEPAPGRRDAARWVALAAIPSALLISVTSHISTDIAAAPFMWVIPLALYLVTFVIVFSNRPILRHEWMVGIEPLFIVALVGVMVFEIRQYIFAILALNVATFFVITIVCHGELSRSRPFARHLTAFYMWMSAGGVIGGNF